MTFPEIDSTPFLASREIMRSIRGAAGTDQNSPPLDQLFADAEVLAKTMSSCVIDELMGQVDPNSKSRWLDTKARMSERYASSEPVKYSSRSIPWETVDKSLKLLSADWRVAVRRCLLGINGLERSLSPEELLDPEIGVFSPPLN